MTFRRVRLTDGQEHIVYDDLICRLPLRAEAVRRRYREIYKETCTCRKRAEIVKGLLYFALDDYFAQYGEREAIPVAELPQEIRWILDLPGCEDK